MVLNIGTVSHGTLRRVDLLEAFLNAYKQYCKDEPDYRDSIVNDATFHLELLQRYENVLSDHMSESVNDLIVDIQDELNGFARRHNCYFGSHEGDGSDFGFWPNEGGEA